MALCLSCYSGPQDAGDGGSSGGETGGDADGSGPGSGPSGSGPTGSGPGDSSGDPTGDDATATATTSDTGPPPTDTPLDERIFVTDVTVPEGVQAGVDNWRIWGRGSLHVAPVFTVPLASCETLVGYTTGGNTARVERLDAGDASVASIELGAGFELRGLAAEPDGHFAALLWNPTAQRIYINRFDAAGTQQYSTELVNPDNTPTDFGIGDSRLEYGNGAYGAYYHVHSDSGHEGDTLKWVDAGSGAESTGWGWGCSHSMSNLLRFNADVGDFLPACVTDCFPGTSGDFGANSIGGIYLNHNDAKVMDVDAGCNGDVAGELGSAALGPAGWALVFNAHQAPATPGQSSYNPATMNQDIGFSAVSSGLTPRRGRVAHRHAGRRTKPIRRSHAGSRRANRGCSTSSAGTSPAPAAITSRASTKAACGSRDRSR